MRARAGCSAALQWCGPLSSETLCTVRSLWRVSGDTARHWGWGTGHCHSATGSVSSCRVGYMWRGVIRTRTHTHNHKIKNFTHTAPLPRARSPQRSPSPPPSPHTDLGVGMGAKTHDLALLSKESAMCAIHTSLTYLLTYTRATHQPHTHKIKCCPQRRGGSQTPHAT